MAAGYIIGNNGTWYLASEEEYWANSAAFVSSLDTNKGTAQAVDKKSGLFKITGFGTGIPVSEWDDGAKTAATNPVTTAARNAIINGFMGLFGNEDFYLGLLEKGYVYQHAWDVDMVSKVGALSGFAPPDIWYNKIRDLIEGWETEQAVLYPKLFPMVIGRPDAYEKGSWKADMKDPALYPPPNYGTNAIPYIETANIKGPQGNDNLPFWVDGALEWFSKYDETLATELGFASSQKTGTGGVYKTAPTQYVYKAQYFVRLFHKEQEGDNISVNYPIIDALQSVGLIFHSPDVATQKLLNDIKKQEEKEEGVGGVEAKNPNEPDTDDIYSLLVKLKGTDLSKNAEIKKLLPNSLAGSKYANALINLLGDDGEYDVDTDIIVGAVDNQEMMGIGVGGIGVGEGAGSVAGKNWSSFFNENMPGAEGGLPPSQLPNPDSIQALYPNATHYVLIKETTGNPPQAKTVTDVYNLPIAKSKAGKLATGDVVIVKKEFVGKDGKWHQVKVLKSDSSLANSKKSPFINSSFLQKLPATPYSLNRSYKCKADPKFDTPDWAKLADKEVFFDKRKCNQCIVVEPVNPKTGKRYTTIVGNELEEAKQSALSIGIVELLKFYNKRMIIDPSDGVNKTLEKISGAFQGPYVGTNDWYLDKRPSSKLKILVKFPSKYFDALPETPEDFRGVAHTSTATLALESSDEEIAFVKDIPSLRTVHFVLPTLKGKIDILSNLMEFYAKKMDGWLGKIPGLDLRKEKARLEDFPLVLFQFLRLNGITVDEKEEDTIELGFDDTFELQYVLINKTGFAAPLRIGFNRFKSRAPINITRTMAYIFYLDDLIREARKKTKIGWIEFVQKYTFPVPEIRPANVASAIDSICRGTTPTKEEFAEKISKTYDQVEVQTTRGMKEVQKKLDSPTMKTELINIRRSAKSFVGDEFTRQIPDLLKRIDDIPTNLEGINELYSSVLNKTDIKNLASLAASTEISKMPSADISLSLGEFALDEMSTDEVTQLYESFSEDIKTKIDVRIEEIDLGVDIESPESSFFSSSIGGVDFSSIDVQKYKKPEASPFQKSIMDNSEIDSQKLGLEEKFAQPSHKIKNAIDSLVEYEALPASDFLNGVELVIPDYKLKYKDLMKPPAPNMPDIPALPSVPDMPSISVSKLSTEIPSLKLPSIPSITIPDVGKDLMKMADTMSDVAENLKNQIEEATCTALVGVVKTTLEGVFDSLFSSAGSAVETASNAASQYGSRNLNSMLESASGPFSVEGECGASKAFEELGIPASIFLDLDPENFPGGNPVAAGTLRTMIDDVSDALTPLEIVDLLEGTAKPETIKAVEDVVRDGYPNYMSHLTDTTTIGDAFNNLGRFIDPNLIDSIKRAARVFPNPGSGLLCDGDTRKEEDEVREMGLRLGSKDRARNQIKRRRRRRRKKLKQFMALSKNADSVLKDILPPTINDCGDKVSSLSDTGHGVLSGMGGLIPRDHESIKYMNKKVIKNMFEIPNMHFNMEVNTYLDSLIKETFRPPRPSDDQYTGFISSLKSQGLEPTPENIQLGVNNELGTANDDFLEQTKFNEALSQNQKLVLQVAPDVKNSFLNTSNFFKNEERQFEMVMGFIEYVLQEGLSGDTWYQSAKEDLESVSSQQDALIQEKKKIDANLEDKEWVQNEMGGPAGYAAATAKQAELGQEITGLNQSVEDAQKTVQEKASAWKGNNPGDIFAVNRTAHLAFANQGVTVSEGYIPHNDWYFELDQPSSFSVLNTFNTTTIEGSGSVVPLSEVNDYSFIEPGAAPAPPSAWSWQEESFANYMIKRWEEAPIASPTFDPLVFSSFYKNRQMTIFSDLVKKFMAMVSQSSLFNLQKLEDVELATDENDPPASTRPCPAPKRPGLLDVKRYQDIVSNLYDEACGDIKQQPTKPNALESSGLQGIVYATIRLYVLEAMLKTIFTLSKFSASSTRGDKLITEIILENVIFGMRKQEENYYKDVRKQAKVITDKRQQTGEKLFNPLSTKAEQVEEDETLGDPNDPRTLSGMSSLRFLIKEQIALLSTEMDTRLNPGVKNLDDFFLGVNKQPFLVPTVDVVRDWQEPRIAATQGSNFDFLSGDTGGFILEKYIRLEDDPNVDPFDAGDAAGLTAEEKEFVQTWRDRPGGLENLFDKVWGPGVGDTFLSLEAHKQGHLSGVVNVHALKEYLETLPNNLLGLGYTKNPNVNLKKIIKNLKFGVRLCYIPPTKTAADGPLENDDSFLHLVEAAAADSAAREAMTQNAIIEKTYSLEENWGLGDMDTDPWHAMHIRGQKTYPLPIVTVEDSLGLDSLETLTIDDLIQILDDSETAFEGLKKQMIQTSKYQFLFNYIFSLPRMLSLVSAYNILSISRTIPGAQDIFPTTKDSFKSMFYTLTPEAPWYSKQDKKHEALGGNVGMMQKDNNSMTMTGPSSLPSSAKICTRAALILVKAAARQMDPHYSMVSKLDDVGAAPFGMTWASVPVFWPVNFSIPPVIYGWGPPLLPLGMIAYSAGLLPGEKKRKKQRAAKKALASGEKCVEGSGEIIFDKPIEDEPADLELEDFD